MTRLQIGRAGLDVDQNLAQQVTWNGDNVTIDSRIVGVTLRDLRAITQQVNGHVDDVDEPVVPIICDTVPALNGYYKVTSANVDLERGGLNYGWWPFSVSATKVHGYAAPLIEARLLGSWRGNYVGIDSGDEIYWHAVPGQVSGYSADGANLTTGSRPTADGDVLVHTGHALRDAWPTWYCDPARYYDGAATIQAGDRPDDGTVTFGATGASQSYTVPSGVYRLRISLRGAQGGGQMGGYGAKVEGTLAVTPGDTLTVKPGGRPQGATGGFNGGGDGGNSSSGDPGFGGGGASDVRLGGTANSNRKLTAGGGGGTGGPKNEPFYKGGYGGPNGREGGNPNHTAGQGGTKAHGGKGGKGLGGGPDGGAGSLGSGGDAPDVTGSHQGPGGGGAGLYGGGSGAGNYLTTSPAGCGGGGSSGADLTVVSDLAITPNANAGAGVISITPIFGAVASSPTIPTPDTVTSDSFNRSNGDLVGSASDGGDDPFTWAELVSGMDSPTITSHKATGGATVTVGASLPVDLDDCTVTVAAVLGTTRVELLARGNSDLSDVVGFNVSPSGVKLVQSVATVTTELASAAPIGTGAHTLALKVSGTGVTGYIDGAVVLTGTTAVAAAGSVGFLIAGDDDLTASTLDDFTVTTETAPDAVDEATDVAADVAYRTVVGHQIPDAPLGWSLDNALVQLRPVFDGTQVLFTVRCWGPSGWSTPRVWRLCRGATTVPTLARPTAVNVLRNSPEECVLRVTYGFEGIYTILVDFTLRRGSPLVYMHLTSDTPQQWGLAITEWDDADDHTGGIHAASDDDDGNRWILSSPFLLTGQTSFNSGLYLATPLRELYAAVGFAPSDISDPDNLTLQYHAWMSEKTLAVSR